MKGVKVVYHSDVDKTVEQASSYTQTQNVPHRYLAYKDIPTFISNFVRGKKALDYGCGAGASSKLLFDLGFDVISVDLSLTMLEQARASFPDIHFCTVNILDKVSKFDLVFSSFVLFELSSKKDIVLYLRKAFSFLKKGGIFIGITGSKHLYSSCRNWLTFDANFDENTNLRSGDIAKLLLKSPKMEFFDYYWEEKDYLDCFEKAGFKILQVHYPLGAFDDPYSWRDELSFSPFVTFIATK